MGPHLPLALGVAVTLLSTRAWAQGAENALGALFTMVIVGAIACGVVGILVVVALVREYKRKQEEKRQNL